MHDPDQPEPPSDPSDQPVRHVHVLVTSFPDPDTLAGSRQLPDGTLALVIDPRVLTGEEAVRDRAHALFVQLLAA